MKPRNNKVALITGGSKRIGACISDTLHSAGIDLVIHYHDSKESALALARKLNERRPRSASLVSGDLRDSKSLEILGKEAIAAFGRLDILVNNASSFYPTPLEQTDEQAWQDLIDTNLKAPYFLVKAIHQELGKQNGCIVNMVDIYAQRPLKSYPVYCAAKAGLVSLTKSLALELAPKVRVNGVAPGAILWPEHDANDQAKQLILEKIPRNRMGRPEEIANTILFLISDADYVNGQIITVDGGRSLSP
ncbi:pteridine reductase [Pseudomonadota bacterium]